VLDDKTRSARQYADRWSDLVELEREEEMRRHEQEIRRLSGREREAKGRALLDLRARDEGESLGGHRVKFMKEQKGTPLPDHELRVGDLVMVSKKDPLRDDNPTGTVTQITNYSVTAAFDPKPDDWALGEGLRLDYESTASYTGSLVEEFDIRGITDVSEITAGELSGGNLQKLILARELDRDPNLLVANQPTRGVDVGAIEFIRQRLLEQRDSGTGILLLSEDLDEIFDLSDRILVIYEGEFVYETTPEAADRRRVGLEMNGGDVGQQPQPVAAADGGRSES